MPTGRVIFRRTTVRTARFNPVETTRLRSFPPAVAGTPRILILGSMPGGESLRQKQYYAFKYNVFWRIAGTVFDFPPDLPYPERIRALNDAGAGLWDVLAGCDRTGSLDATIRRPEPNDIPGLLRAFPTIRRICCNGGTAARCLYRYFPEIELEIYALPSTSPAAARLGYNEKLERWRAALKPDRSEPR